MSGDPRTRREWSFPPDDWLASFHPRLGFRGAVVLATLLAAGLDAAVFGFPSTVVPYNYPFFGDVVLLPAAAVILRRTYHGLHEVKFELMQLADHQLEDVSVGLDRSVSPDRIRGETDRLLGLVYHPLAVAGGALFGGGMTFAIMAALDVLQYYPYWLMNFAVGAAHGLFIVPGVGGFAFVLLASRVYIVDINLLDPDGVGGYRRIGDTLVRIVSYGIFLVTLDFVILSSVAFTPASRFQQVVAALYLLTLGALIVGTVVATLAIRSKLLAIRDRKVDLMQEEFSQLEREYWQKHDADADNQPEALQLMTMTTMFNEISRMNMWPINLYSLARLAGSVGFSLGVFLVQNLGLVPSQLPF